MSVLAHMMAILVLWCVSAAGRALAGLVWCAHHRLVVAPVVVAAAAGVHVVRVRLARAALGDRVRFTLTPSRRFEPGTEEIWRYAAVLLRAAGGGPWWAPQRARSVRLRLRADGSTPLDFSVEGHARVRQMLAGSPYGEVEVARAAPLRDKAKEHTVRAEFTLHGNPAATLREVPLAPDPLQPLVDAVADLRADLGDLAEVVIDVQPVPRWRLRLRRSQLLGEARARARAEARRETRLGFADAAEVDDTWRSQIAELLGPERGRSPLGRRLAVPARPRPVDTDKTWGRLGRDSGLVRIQLLVRCASDQAGRAEARMRRVAAAMDVYADGNRLRMDGRSLGPFHLGANSRLRRGSFDRRWDSGMVVPRTENWVHISEIAGLLKPTTVHCRLPVLAREVPSYEVGSEALIPHGWYRAPDGRRRLLASPAAETFFSLAVGKSRYGKTERAAVQALALAAGGHGVGFVDPHADSWRAVLPFLACDAIRDRVRYLDLTGDDPQVPLPAWNPMGMEGTRGKADHEVVRCVVDSFASVMGWADGSAPRALTIFTKAVEALVHLNGRAVAAGAPGAQATIFQIRALLLDPAWRELAVSQLPGPMRRWWDTTFLTLPDDAFAVVINPLDRLAADPIAHALLGTPISGWDARQAMDQGQVVWICPAGTGPTDRLLVSLLLQDLFRAGKSRRDLSPERRRPYHLFVDELISLDSASSGVLAEMNEELGKFGLRLHASTQLLDRISTATRQSMLQNSSVLSCTAGSTAAISLMVEEWHGAVSAARIAELPRFHHYVSLTINGERIGPLPIEGPRIGEVFRSLRAPGQVRPMLAASHQATGARRPAVLRRIAAAQDEQVRAFWSGPPRPPTDPEPEPPAPEPEDGDGGGAAVLHLPNAPKDLYR